MICSKTKRSCPLSSQELLSRVFVLQPTREEPQEGCSSSPELSCSPVSASECGASAAGASLGTTAAHSTRPRSDSWSPPCAGPCSSGAAAATSSQVPAETRAGERPRTGPGTQVGLPPPGQSSRGWGRGSAGVGQLGGGCGWG